MIMNGNLSAGVTVISYMGRTAESIAKGVIFLFRA